MKVLLSIKPEFADKIFSGEKRFEYRRTIFKKEVTTVVVYASSPTQKVIGEFEIDYILSNDIATLWNQTSEFAGISEWYFRQYFLNKETGYAIKVKSFKKYKKPLCINKYFGVTPPQSFVYLGE